MFKIALYKGTKLIGYVVKDIHTGEEFTYKSRLGATNKVSVLKRKFTLPEGYYLKTEKIEIWELRLARIERGES